MSNDDLHKLLAILSAKVMVLENAVAIALAGVMGRHPDPLGMMAALESNLDRRSAEVADTLSSSAARDEVADAAKAEVALLLRVCQQTLDEIERDRAARQPPSDSEKP